MARVPFSITVLDVAGNAISLANVQVNVRGGPEATVYNAEVGGTTVSNPLATPANGRAEGWLDRGEYEAVISKAGLPSQTRYFDAVPAGTGEIEATMLADGAVTEDKLAADAVTNAKIAADAVTVDKIATGSQDGHVIQRSGGTTAWGAIPAHQGGHQSGAADPITGSLDANARLAVRANSGGSVYTRRRLNVIAGTNITVGVADDAGNEEVDLTVSAAGNVIQTPAFTSPYTPDLAAGNIVVMALTGDITINAPVNMQSGSILTLILIQDATGGRRITFDPVFRGWVGQTLDPSTTLGSQWFYHAGDGTWRGIAVNGSMVPFRVSLNGAGDVTRRTLNFVEGSGIDITVVDDPANEEADVTIATTDVGAPADASFVVVNESGGLSAEHTLANVLGRGLASARPAASVPGRYYLATDTRVLSQDTGGAWVDLGVLVTTAAAQTYTVSNVSTLRTYDANNTSLNEIADTLGTLVADLRAKGLVL